VGIKLNQSICDGFTSINGASDCNGSCVIYQLVAFRCQQLKAIDLKSPSPATTAFSPPFGDYARRHYLEGKGEQLIDPV